MKKMVMMSAVLLAAANAAMATDATAFLDKIKAANPVDRWMPSGSIEYTTQTVKTSSVGDVLDFTIQGTLDYNKDHARFERHRTDGAFPFDPVHRDDLHNARIPDDVILWISPNEISASFPSDGITGRMTEKRAVDGYALLNAGVLTKSVLDSLDMTAAPANRRTFRSVDPSPFAASVSFDDLGRLTEREASDSTRSVQYQFREHVKLDNGKWAPGHITVYRQSNGKESWNEYRLRFKPGSPTDESLLSDRPKDAKDSQIGCAQPAANANKSAFSSPETAKLGRWLSFKKCLCGSLYPTYTSYCCLSTESNCAAATADKYFSHAHCGFSYWPNDACMSQDSVWIRTSWPCYWMYGTLNYKCGDPPPDQFFCHEDYTEEWHYVEDNVCAYTRMSGQYCAPCNEQ